MGIEQRYHFLQDVLASTSADVDGVLDSGWGFPFPVKGRSRRRADQIVHVAGPVVE